MPRIGITNQGWIMHKDRYKNAIHTYYTYIAQQYLGGIAKLNQVRQVGLGIRLVRLNRFGFAVNRNVYNT